MLRRVLIPLVITVLALTAFQLRARKDMVDFDVYRQAATRAFHAEPLYRESDEHYQFKYLPAYALLTFPIALVDAQSAKLMWFAATVGALVLLVRWSVRFLPERRRGAGVLIALTTLFMLKFYVHELDLGQTNVFFALLVVAGIGAIQSDATGLGGGLLGLAVIAKPYAVLFAPWLLLNGGLKDRRAIVMFSAVVGLALILPLPIYGVRGTIDLLAGWWHTVTTTTAPNLFIQDNVSFASLWAKWLGDGLPARALASLTSAAALTLVVDMWSRRRGVNEPVYLEVSALLMLVPLLSPQGWDYVLLLGTPAVALLFDRLPELERPWQVTAWISLGLLGFLVFDLVGRAFYHRLLMMNVIPLAAVAVVLCLSHMRRRSLA